VGCKWYGLAMSQNYVMNSTLAIGWGVTLKKQCGVHQGLYQQVKGAQVVVLFCSVICTSVPHQRSRHLPYCLQFTFLPNKSGCKSRCSCFRRLVGLTGGSLITLAPSSAAAKQNSGAGRGPLELQWIAFSAC
jgi:hypothetical protein